MCLKNSTKDPQLISLLAVLHSHDEAQPLVFNCQYFFANMVAPVQSIKRCALSPKSYLW